MLDRPTYHAILEFITDSNTTLSEVLTCLLLDSSVEDHRLVLDIIDRTADILDTLYRKPAAQEVTVKWAHDIVIKSHMRSLRELACTHHGWHFNVTNATADQIKDFRIEDMARHIKATAPMLWHMVYKLLSLKTLIASQSREQGADHLMDWEDSDEEDNDEYEMEFWEQFGHDNTPDLETGSSDHPPPRPWRHWKRSELHDAIARVVRVTSHSSQLFDITSVHRKLRRS